MSYCKSAKQVSEKALSFEEKKMVSVCPLFLQGLLKMTSTTSLSLAEIKINHHVANL